MYPKAIALSNPLICADCHGRGRVFGALDAPPGIGVKPCAGCDGTGHGPGCPCDDCDHGRTDEHLEGLYLDWCQDEGRCSACTGLGWTIGTDHVCPDCLGDGFPPAKVKKRLVVVGRKLGRWPMQIVTV